MRMFADNIDITAYVGGLSWQNTIAELATTMSFETAKTDAKHLDFYEPHEGSIINLYNYASGGSPVEIFRGIVLTVDDGSKTSNKYTAVDFGWYLNKSKETYQFNEMPAFKAIRKVCEDFNVPIDNMPELTTEITQIYIDNTISEIIQDILKFCGGGFNFDVTPRGLQIYWIGTVIAYPQFRLSPNTQLLDSISLRGGVSHSVSIEDLKNCVKVVSEKDDAFTVMTVLKDNDSIYKYGFLQEVVKIDPEKEEATTVASKALSELNRKKETFSIEVIEAIDSYTRAGSVIYIEDSLYVIDGSSHSIKNGIHYVKLDLKSMYNV